MSLINKIKKGILYFTAAWILAGCALGQRANNKKAIITNEKEKYAVICIGASCRNANEGLVDPIDKNCFWINAVKVYNELLEQGFDAKNIFVLYKDGKPPFDDKEFENKIKRIKEEFNGTYSNLATRPNLEKLLNKLETSIDSNDEFLLCLSMHGDSSGRIHFEYDGSVLSGRGLSTILKGNKAERILIFTDVCHAEAFIDDINYSAILIASSKRGYFSWSDRNFSSSSVFFEELGNKENDKDGDGKVSAYEAFIATKRRCIAYRKKIDYFLKNEYEGKGLPEHDLERMDFIPVYKER